MLSLFKGLIIGFSVSAPVGPIGVICADYALRRGFFIAFLAGLGAALADTLFAGLAIMGINLVQDWFIAYAQEMSLAGGGVLCFLGGQALMNSTSSKENNSPLSSNRLWAFVSTFLLTLTNPLTLLTFAAILSHFGEFDAINSYLTIAGVFFGSLIWWLFWSFSASLVRKKLDSSFLKIIRIVFAAIILTSGVVVILLASLR